MQNVISRTPLRITFAGGGTDLPYFSRKEGGAVLNAAINKHIYIFVHKSFDDKIRLRYSKNEEVKSSDQISHPIYREAFKLLRIREPLEIASLADITSKGSGLGSSGTFTVGLLNALYAWKQIPVTREELVRAAFRIENKRLKTNCGMQDEAAAAFGGINLFEFNRNGSFEPKRIALNHDSIMELQKRMLLLNLGMTRSAQQTLKEVPLFNNQEQMMERKRMAYELYYELLQGNWEQTGNFILKGNRLKIKGGDKGKESMIDRICQKIEKEGVPVKSIGASYGGFLLAFAKPSMQESIVKVSGLKRVPIKFDFEGSKIIYAD
ncbi:MAG: kinase [Candidatus Micrarchaeota archaeon]|nr:kinase [Candidatus Micrarchaeota archaeon]